MWDDLCKMILNGWCDDLKRYKGSLYDWNIEYVTQINLQFVMLIVNEWIDAKKWQLMDMMQI